MKTAIFAVALLAASPALADHETSRERWLDERQRWIELVENCEGQYVQAYDGHCANVADDILRRERKRRDIDGHFHSGRNRHHTEQTQRQWCRNNPAYCADSEPRHYGRR